MKSTKHLLSILLLLCLSFTSCDIDDGLSNNNNQQQEIPNSFSEYFGNDISRDFLGTVVDKNHLPISGVTITIGSETALTDNNGVFIIRDANVNKRFGYVKAEKVGYIHASRSVVPTDGTNKVNIMMLDDNITGSINSGSIGTVSLSNGSSVSFDGNFIKEDGSAYSGSVDVIMHHLDPTDDDMSQQMPGMLYAQNEEGAERMLQTLGMLAVELRGSGGEDLNLAEGSTSEIKIPVDASLMNIAPATIPLWYFDEVNGYWKEEGEATLQGNMYVGTVSHFSFWNCDIPNEAITLCVTATDEDGNVLSNLNISISSATYGTRDGYTNENGEVCGFVPINESLELNVYSYAICGESPVHIESIGPFSTDSSISIIITDNSNIIHETVIGKFITCERNPVLDGYVQVSYGGQTFIDIVTDSSFEINLLRCTETNTFIIQGIDYINLQTTEDISYTFTSPLTDIGFLSACNTITEFIEYTIDENESLFFFENEYILAEFNNEPNSFYSGPSIVIHAYNSSQEYCYGLVGILDNVDYLGTYGNYYNSNNTTNENGFNPHLHNCLDINQENDNIIFNLTAFGEVSEYIDINFSGSYQDDDGNPHTINGIVHVLRDQ